MKSLLVKWLSTLMIAALLLSPAALTEADPAGAALPAEGEPEATVAEEVAPEAADDAVAEVEGDLDESDLPESDLYESDLSESDLPESGLPESGLPGSGDGAQEAYTCETEPIADGETLLNGYVERLFGLNDGALFAARNVGEDLTGEKKTLYTALKNGVLEIAAGTRASTVFTFEDSSLGFDEVGDVIHCLIADHPYEMYWYGNGYALKQSGFMLTISLSVGSAYASGIYTVNASTAATAAAAAANARAIVAKYAGESDYKKLVGYRNAICDAVSYNTAAAAGEWNMSEKNPWQLVWVFDGDPSTNVVCEGYAKAFQYLCDMTDFSGNVICYSVTGAYSGGSHKWNIVRMPNGKNYLVDVTLCDQERSGTYDWFFMKAPGGGGVDQGYSFTVKIGTRKLSGTYVFDEDTKAIYSAADLTLSAGGYLDDIKETDPSSPDAPTSTITVLKNTRATVNAGSVYQIDLGGRTAKSFKSSKKKVAVVNAAGVITARAAGKARITIKIGRKKRVLTLKVVDPTVPASVSLSQTGTLRWYKQDPLTLTAAIPEGTNSAIRWKSSNKKVATVKNGVVTFKKAGKTTITATAVRGRKKARVKIIVLDGSRASAVAIVPPASTAIKVGESLALSASAVLARPADPNNPTFDPTARWKSSRKAVAAVNKVTGVLTARKPGTTTVTVTTGSGKKASIRITVVN